MERRKMKRNEIALQKEKMVKQRRKEGKFEKSKMKRKKKRKK